MEGAAPMSTDPNPWRELFWETALALNCLPSTFVDANAHVLRKAKKLAEGPRAVLCGVTAQEAEEDVAYLASQNDKMRAEIAHLTAELEEARRDSGIRMSEAALEAAAKAMAEAFDYPWEYMPTVGRINMRTIAKNVIDAAM